MVRRHIDFEVKHWCTAQEKYKNCLLGLIFLLVFLPTETFGFRRKVKHFAKLRCHELFAQHQVQHQVDVDHVGADVDVGTLISLISERFEVRSEKQSRKLLT